MRVLDGSVLVLDATAGVQAQTSKVFSQIKRCAVIRIWTVRKSQIKVRHGLRTVEITCNHSRI